jgi:hypothetical protein
MRRTEPPRPLLSARQGGGNEGAAWGFALWCSSSTHYCAGNLAGLSLHPTSDPFGQKDTVGDRVSLVNCSRLI